MIRVDMTSSSTSTTDVCQVATVVLVSADTACNWRAGMYALVQTMFCTVIITPYAYLLDKLLLNNELSLTQFGQLDVSEVWFTRI